MKVRLLLKNGTLTARLAGELDHHSAVPARETIDDTARRMRPHTMKLDFSEITFMDSSGIALILRAQQRMQLLEGSLQVRNVPPQARRVLDAASVSRLVNIK